MDSREHVRNHASKVVGDSGKVRITVAKRLRFEGGNRIEGEAQAKAEARAGGEGWGRCLLSPSPEKFWNFELQIVKSGV